MLLLKKNKHRGKLIVFEGTDGAGKTTLIELTAKYLSEKMNPEQLYLTKQPTDLSRNTKLFQKMMYSKENKDIHYRAVQLLTLSDRIQHNFEIIEPLLKAGKIILCDRYIFTSIANMRARGYSKEKWFFQACKEIIRPDIAFLMNINPQRAIERIKNRPEEAGRFLNEELLHKVSKNFIKLRKWANFKVIDTEKNPEIVFQNVKKFLDQALENYYD